MAPTALQGEWKDKDMPLIDTPWPDCKSKKIRTQRISLPNGGHHIKATCAACDRFIKFLPHDSPAFHFGRYKGFTVTEIAIKDLSYLKWCLSANVIRNSRVRDAVEYEVLTT